MAKIIKVSDPGGIISGDTDTKPFMLRERTRVEMAEYDAGFRAGLEGKEPEDHESLSWQRGWAEARE
jgi:hypothetical protein